MTMKLFQSKIFILFLTVSFGLGCEVQYCDECSTNNKECNKCINGYSINATKTACNKQSESSSSPNIGLIVGLSVSILVGLFLVYFAYKKCMSSSSKTKNENGETENTYHYGGNFGCMGMGMVDPMNCMTYTNSTNHTEQYKNNYECYDYNSKFRHINERCLDSRNDCDRFAFKLDRKENLHPEWCNKEFTKYVPLKPSKKLVKITQFSRLFMLIPQNILEMTPEEIISAQNNPVYEPIKKNSIDDKLMLEKQSSNNSEKFSSEDTICSCSLKVRSASTATECPSNKGDDVATEEMISQDKFYCNDDFMKTNGNDFQNDFECQQQNENNLTSTNTCQNETQQNEQNNNNENKNSCVQSDCVVIQIEDELNQKEVGQKSTSNNINYNNINHNQQENHDQFVVIEIPSESQ